MQMIHDTLSHRRPRTASTSSGPLTGIAHQAGTHLERTNTVEMRRQDVIDEDLFRLAFDMDQQSSHGQ